MGIIEGEINGVKLKYEDGKLFRWRTKCARGVLRIPKWSEVSITPNKLGYSNINLNHRTYLVHRVIYKLHNPEWDINDNSRENEVDHINGVSPKNNNIENLRILNHKQNIQNSLHYAKGFYLNANGKYQAQIIYDGKSKYLGCYDDAEDAHNAYLIAKKKYHVF